MKKKNPWLDPFLQGNQEIVWLWHHNLYCNRKCPQCGSDESPNTTETPKYPYVFAKY